MHFVPAGRLATIACWPTFVGAWKEVGSWLVRWISFREDEILTAIPLVVTVIATKLVPFPVASTLAVTLREPSAPLRVRFEG